MVEMAQAKYSGLRIIDLKSEENFQIISQTILLRICASTGWKMPQNEYMANALVKEFTLYLGENCKDMAVEEIMYSIRNYGLQVQDWGKDINLQLINQPLEDYRQARIELSRLEEQKAIPEPQPETMSEPADWSDTWERLVNGEIKGQFYNLTPWSAIYDWLERAGKIKPKNAEKWNWLQEACVKEINNLAIKKEAFQATVEEKAMLVRLQVMKWDRGKFPDDKVALAHLISPSKRTAVQQLLTKIKSENES